MLKMTTVRLQISTFSIPTCLRTMQSFRPLRILWVICIANFRGGQLDWHITSPYRKDDTTDPATSFGFASIELSDRMELLTEMIASKLGVQVSELENGTPGISLSTGDDVVCLIQSEHFGLSDLKRAVLPAEKAQEETLV